MICKIFIVLSCLAAPSLCQVQTQYWKRVNISETDWRTGFAKTYHQLSPDEIGLSKCGGSCQKLGEHCDLFMFDKAKGKCIHADETQLIFLSQKDDNDLIAFAKAKEDLISLI